MRHWIAAAALLVLHSGTATAGGIIAPDPHRLDPRDKQVDRAPPPLMPTVSVKIKRGKGPVVSYRNGEKIVVTSSWDDLGYIEMNLTPRPDDRTPASELGYRMELTSGSLPKSLELWNYDFRAPHAVIQLVWIDGNTDEQEPVHFTISLRAIDKAGHVGLPTGVAIDDPGRPGAPARPRR